MRKPMFQVYNAITKRKEVFEPKVPGKVGMCICGVTAYNYSHLGHARAYVAFDVLYRYLKHLDYDVNYVCNFMDVDEKIINAAKEGNEHPLALSSRSAKNFLMTWLTFSAFHQVINHMFLITWTK